MAVNAAPDSLVFRVSKLPLEIIYTNSCSAEADYLRRLPGLCLRGTTRWVSQPRSPIPKGLRFKPEECQRCCFFRTIFQNRLDQVTSEDIIELTDYSADSADRPDPRHWCFPHTRTDNVIHSYAIHSRTRPGLMRQNQLVLTTTSQFN